MIMTATECLTGTGIDTVTGAFHYSLLYVTLLFPVVDSTLYTWSSKVSRKSFVDVYMESPADQMLFVAYSI